MHCLQSWKYFFHNIPLRQIFPCSSHLYIVLLILVSLSKFWHLIIFTLWYWFFTTGSRFWILTFRCMYCNKLCLFTCPVSWTAKSFLVHCLLTKLFLIIWNRFPLTLSHSVVFLAGYWKVCLCCSGFAQVYY